MSTFNTTTVLSDKSDLDFFVYCEHEGPGPGGGLMGLRP
jgi:hypothetical protein